MIEVRVSGRVIDEPHRVLDRRGQPVSMVSVIAGAGGAESLCVLKASGEQAHRVARARVGYFITATGTGVVARNEAQNDAARRGKLMVRASHIESIKRSDGTELSLED